MSLIFTKLPCPIGSFFVKKGRLTLFILSPSQKLHRESRSLSPWESLLFVTNNCNYKKYYRQFHTNLGLYGAAESLPKIKKTCDYDAAQANNIFIIARILGLSPNEVTKAPRKPINEALGVETFKTLQDHGFGIGQILRQPDVFMLTPGSVLNYIEVMKESCFSEINLSMIIRFTNVHKQTLKVLKEKCVTPNHAEIVSNYCNVLNIAGSKTEDDLWNHLPSNTERLTLGELRKYTIAIYLSMRLDTDLTEITETVMKHPRLHNRCLKWVKQIIDILLNIGFSKEKIRKHAYLLHANSPNAEKMIHEIKTLSGIPLKEIALCRPKILMSLCSSLQEIDNLFKEHKIPHTSIVKYPEIYTLSPKTVKERLEELDKIPEFRPLKCHQRVIRLLYYQNKAKARIEHLKSLDLFGASLHLLSSDTKRYKKLMALGEMKNRGSDVTNYLNEYLGSEWTMRQIRSNLMRHPHWLNCSLVKVKDSLQFIDNFNVFTKQQVFSALPLLLYPKEKIEKEFENVVIFNEAKVSDEWFLHMVLYFLERTVHFSGDGIWNTKSNVRDDDDQEDSISDDGHHNQNDDFHATEEDNQDKFGWPKVSISKVKSV